MVTAVIGKITEPSRFNLTNTIISTINRVGCDGIQSEIVVLDGALCIPDGTGWDAGGNK